MTDSSSAKKRDGGEGVRKTGPDEAAEKESRGNESLRGSWSGKTAGNVRGVNEKPRETGPDMTSGNERRESVSIIAAMTKKGVIGIGNSLPWRIPEDLRLFRKLTTGNIVIMGRKTYESIGKPLPGRKNFVISSSVPASGAQELSQMADPESIGPFYFSSLENALSAALSVPGELFVIGGASVYRQALPYAGTIYISLIKKEYEGNVFFPDFDRAGWFAAEETDYGEFTLQVLKRQ